jgi:fatty-acyl-CoA synthase
MTHQTITTQFLMASTLKKFSSKIFAKIEEEEYTYDDVHLNSNRIANGIQSLGFGPGDRIAVAIPNSMEIVYAAFGVFKSGATIVGINMMVGDKDLLFILKDAGIKMALVDPAVEERILKMKGELPLLKTIVTVGGTTRDNITSWDEFVKRQPENDPPLTALPDDDALIVYTGGTTGTPKGVIHSQSSFYYLLVAQSLAYNLLPSDTILLMTPLAHAAGAIMYLGCVNGVRFIIEKKADLFRLLNLIAREKVTVMFLVPTIIYILLDVLKAGNYDMSSLRMLLYGAAPMSEGRLAEAMERFGPILVQLYGQTECPQAVTTLSMDDHIRALKNPRLLSSCGKPCQMAAVRIVDDNGRDLPVEETGEILVKAPFVMKGYLNHPEMTAATVVDGWLHTSDMGKLDEEGYLYIVDRKKDMIITGAFNVYSASVENVISKHPKVKQVAVIGIPDEKWGETVTAVIVPDGEMTEEEVLGYCKGKLNKYEQPKVVIFREQIPVTAVGKIDKKALRAPYWEGKERGVN